MHLHSQPHPYRHRSLRVTAWAAAVEVAAVAAELWPRAWQVDPPAGVVACVTAVAWLLRHHARHDDCLPLLAAVMAGVATVAEAATTEACGSAVESQLAPVLGVALPAAVSHVLAPPVAALVPRTQQCCRCPRTRCPKLPATPANRSPSASSTRAARQGCHRQGFCRRHARQELAVRHQS